MEDAAKNSVQRWMPITRAYGVAGCCLVLGLAAGYLARASRTPASRNAVTEPSLSASTGTGHVPSLEDLKQMADRQAAPLLEKLKADPNNSALLVQVGTIYHTSRQFTAAAAYYRRAAQADPANLSIRTKYAASLYRSGDADGALEQLNVALRISPTDANTLFNVGLIRWEGKHDAPGALAAWRKLLESNPRLSAERKAAVQQHIVEVRASQGALPAAERSQPQ